MKLFCNYFFFIQKSSWNLFGKLKEWYTLQDVNKIYGLLNVFLPENSQLWQYNFPEHKSILVVHRIQTIAGDGLGSKFFSNCISRQAIHVNLNIDHMYMSTRHARILPFFQKCLSDVFGCTELHKKGSRNTSFLYLRKLSPFWGQFSSTALVKNNVWHKKCLGITISQY